METYETGATSHAVNELVLYVDTTSTLAAMRDECYQRFYESHGVLTGEAQFRTGLAHLLNSAVHQWTQEFKSIKKEVTDMRALNKSQRAEFVELYKKDFNNWKREKYGK